MPKPSKPVAAAAASGVIDPNPMERSCIASRVRFIRVLLRRGEHLQAAKEIQSDRSSRVRRQPRSTCRQCERNEGSAVRSARSAPAPPYASASRRPAVRTYLRWPGLFYAIARARQPESTEPPQRQCFVRTPCSDMGRKILHLRRSEVEGQE